MEEENKIELLVNEKKDENENKIVIPQEEPKKIEIEVMANEKVLTKRQKNYQVYVEALAVLYKMVKDKNDSIDLKKVFDPASPWMRPENLVRHLAAVTAYADVVNGDKSTKAEIQAAAKKHLLVADLKQVGLDAATIGAIGAGALALIFAGLVIASLASPAAAAGTAAMLLKPAFMASLKIACQHAASVMLAHHAAIPVAVAGASVAAFLGKTTTNPNSFYHHSRIKAFKPEKVEKVKGEDDTSSLLINN